MVKRIGRRRMLVAGGAVAAVAVTTFALGGGEGPESAPVARLVNGDVAAGLKAQESEAFAGGSTAVVATDAAATGGMAAAADERSQVAPLPPGVGTASVIRTATLEVEVAEGRFDATFSKVPIIATGHGGFVASSTSTTSAEDGRMAGGTLVVRVPAERFDAVRDELRKLGELRSQQLRGDDVGPQLTDLDARLRNLRSQEEAMRLLMAKTTNVGETIEVQRQLSGVREQIERLSAERARLTDAVAMSTITVSLLEPGVALRPQEGTSLGDAVGRALAGAERVVAAVIVSLGYLLPLALLAGLAWLVARPFLRLRRVPDDTAPAAP